MGSTVRVMGAALLWCSALPVAAQEMPTTEPSVLFHDAQTLEARRDFEAAEENYRILVTQHGASRAARRAAIRLSWLEPRKDERLGYEPLAKLERMRRESPDPARLESFELEIAAMPPGTVKREAWLLLGEAWFRRQSDPGRALRYYREAMAGAARPKEDQLAHVSLAEALTALGRSEEALEHLEAMGMGNAFEARQLRQTLRRETRRYGAWLVLLMGVLGLVFTGRLWRGDVRKALRSIAPRHLLAAAYVLVIPALLAELFESGTADTFLLFAAGASPILLATYVSGVKARGAAQKAVLLAMAIVAILPTAYLALDHSDALSSFGL